MGAQSVRTTLSAYTKRHTMTHLGAVNLGIDLCAALTIARKAGYLYQDLKPENVFITQQKQYQLGIWGLLPWMSCPIPRFRTNTAVSIRRRSC